MRIRFLTLADLLIIHADQVERYGGAAEVRDLGLLQSAIAQPQAGYAGHLLHADLYEMAAAYLFHICLNHPFVDGNKRIALAAALVFLDLNGIELKDPAGKLYRATMDVAAGRLSKGAPSELFRDLQ